MTFLAECRLFKSPSRRAKRYYCFLFPAACHLKLAKFAKNC